jgi:hypothetical protein
MPFSNAAAPVLAMHQGREVPPDDMAVEPDPLVGGQSVPEFRAVNVDEIVGDQAAVAFEWPSPVDVRRRVPLVDLGRRRISACSQS